MMIIELMEEAIKHKVAHTAALTEVQLKLNPIMTEAGICDIARDVIEFCYIEDNNLIVLTERETRIGIDKYRYEIPLSIIQAVDPIEAARGYKNTRLRDARAKKLAEFNVLAKELGKS